MAAFRRGKNGHENFRQTRIYNFRDKCVVFACKRKFNSEILDMFSFLSVVGATSDCSWLG